MLSLLLGDIFKQWSRHLLYGLPIGLLSNLRINKLQRLRRGNLPSEQWSNELHNMCLGHLLRRWGQCMQCELSRGQLAIRFIELFVVRRGQVSVERISSELLTLLAWMVYE